MERSLKSEILKYLKDGNWKFGGEIEDYVREQFGNKASNASRRCRELVEENKLDREEVRVGRLHVVRYRLKIGDPVQASLFTLPMIKQAWRN